MTDTKRIRSDETDMEVCMRNCHEAPPKVKKVWEKVIPYPGQGHKDPVRITLQVSGGSGTRITDLPAEIANSPEGMSYGTLRQKIEDEEIPELERLTGLRIRREDLPETIYDDILREARIREAEDQLDEDIKRKEAERRVEKRKRDRHTFKHPKEWRNTKSGRFMRKFFGAKEIPDEPVPNPREFRKQQMEGYAEKDPAEFKKRQLEKEKGIRPQDEKKDIGPYPEYFGPVCDPTCKVTQRGVFRSERRTCLDFDKTCLLGPGDPGFRDKNIQFCDDPSKDICNDRRESQLKEAQDILDHQKEYGFYFGEPPPPPKTECQKKTCRSDEGEKEGEEEGEDEEDVPRILRNFLRDCRHDRRRICRKGSTRENRRKPCEKRSNRSTKQICGQERRQESRHKCPYMQKMQRKPDELRERRSVCRRDGRSDLRSKSRRECRARSMQPSIPEFRQKSCRESIPESESENGPCRRAESRPERRSEGMRLESSCNKPLPREPNTCRRYHQMGSFPAERTSTSRDSTPGPSCQQTSLQTRPSSSSGSQSIWQCPSKKRRDARRKNTAQTTAETQSRQTCQRTPGGNRSRREDPYQRLMTGVYPSSASQGQFHRKCGPYEDTS